MGCATTAIVDNISYSITFYYYYNAIHNLFRCYYCSFHANFKRNYLLEGHFLKIEIALALFLPFITIIIFN